MKNIQIVVSVSVAMLTGAASYHQLMPHHIYSQETVPAYRVEQLAAEPTVIEELEVDFDLEHLEVVEVAKEDIYEEAYFDDLELLALCVEAEAGNQDLIGKRMVADVILNRVEDEAWPDTIEAVIKQKNQFATWSNGAMDRVSPSEDTFEACRMELRERGWPGIYYFTANGYGHYGTPWRKVGDHYFCTK